MNYTQKFLKIVIISTGVLCLLIIIIFSILFLKIYRYSLIDEAQKADVIAVLGASQWNGKPSYVLKSRLDHALYLYDNGFADKFILTGGIGEGEKISESQAGKDYLIEKGIDAEDIFIEEIGRTTWQSMNQVSNIMREQGLKSVILASNGYHNFRLKKMSEDLRIKSYVSSVEENLSWREQTRKSKYVLREAVVYIIYRIAKM